MSWGRALMAGPSAGSTEERFPNTSCTTSTRSAVYWRNLGRYPIGQRDGRKPVAKCALCGDATSAWLNSNSLWRTSHLRQAVDITHRPPACALAATPPKLAEQLRSDSWCPLLTS